MKNFPTNSEYSLEIEIRLQVGGREVQKKILQPLKGKSKCCVYLIRNQITGDIYVGKTSNIFNRMKAHTGKLISGKHPSKLMIEHWNNEEMQKECMSRGIQLFEFQTLVYCRESELTFYENLLIKFLNPVYNTHKEK